MFKTTFNATNVGTKSITNTRLKKQQHKNQKQIKNLVFNYSKKVLTVKMKNVLNRGLNFCILPIKIDITKIIWSELCYDKETTEEEKIFSKQRKTRPGDLVGAGPNWVTFWSKFGLF